MLQPNPLNERNEMKQSKHAVRAAGSLLAIAALAACGPKPAPPTPRPAGPALAAVGDSALYLEVTTSTATFQRDTMKPMEVTTRQSGALHVLRTAPDSLEAWFEGLYLRVKSPAADSKIDTKPILYLRYKLLEEDGRVRAVEVPSIPPEIAAASDVRREFYDFFPRLPADQALPVGRTWTDTLVRSDTSSNAELEMSFATTYRVTGDTTVAGVAGRVIRYDTDIRVTSQGRSTTASMRSTLTGTEAGVYVYSPERRLMLSRAGSGDLAGTFSAGSASARQFYVYDTTIDIQPDWGRETVDADEADRPR